MVPGEVGEAGEELGEGRVLQLGRSWSKGPGSGGGPQATEIRALGVDVALLVELGVLTSRSATR